MLHNYTILVISIYMHGKNDFKLKYPEIQIGYGSKNNFVEHQNNYVENSTA